MKNKFVGIVIVLGFIISACTAAQTEDLTATEMPLETEAVATSAPEAGECLACHVDKQRLVDTAKPEEASHEAESTGVG